MFAARKILIVDDNEDAGSTLATLLRTMGHVTEFVRDGLAGYEKTIEWRPEIILLDLDMPIMNGYAAAKAIRNNEHIKDAKIVAVTGWSGEKERQQTKEAGFDRHLVKPVFPQQLEELLDSESSLFS